MEDHVIVVYMWVAEVHVTNSATARIVAVGNSGGGKAQAPRIEYEVPIEEAPRYGDRLSVEIARDRRPSD